MTLPPIPIGHSGHGLPGILPPRSNLANGGVVTMDAQNPRLPQWIPPAQDPQPGRDHINSSATEKSRRTASVSAEGTVLPICYGEDVIGPIITLVKVIGTYLVLRCVWCLGEIEEITKVTLEDGTDIQGVIMTHYTGRADQQPDPFLTANIAGYNDKCVVPVGDEMYGVAYSVIRVPAQANIGFPRFTAKIKGRKVRDPRGMDFYDDISGNFPAASPRPATAFDGTSHQYKLSPNTQAKRATSLGLADSAIGTVQFAYKSPAAGVAECIFDIAGGKLQVLKTAANFIQVVGRNAANTLVLSCISTKAIAAGDNTNVVISWNLAQNKCWIFVGGVNATPVSYTATSGQLINVSAANVSVGGQYNGTQLVNANLAAFGFHTTYYDLSLQPNIALFFDAQKNLMAAPFSAYPNALWAPDGYVANSFTYTNLPTTYADPCGWLLSGIVSKDKYVAPGYKGGLYYCNKTNDASFFVTSTGYITANIQNGVYSVCEVAAGGVTIGTPDYGTLISLNQSNLEQAADFSVPTDEQIVIKADTTAGASTAVKLAKVYVFPEPSEYSTRFLPPLDGEWEVDYGNVAIADPVIGGLALDGDFGPCSVFSAKSQYAPGEEVFYKIEIDSANLFTGDVVLGIGNVDVAFTEGGVYTGSVVSQGSQTNIRFMKPGGTVIIKRLQLRTRTTAKIFSKTPSLILADILESKAYGLGGRCDDGSLLAAARFNEQIIYDNGQARHQIGLSMMERNSITSWIETLRAYARVYIVPRDGQYYLVPDAPAAVVGDITVSNIVKGTFKPAKRSLRNLPNVVKVYYTNTSVTPWTEDFVEAVSPAVIRGEEYRRETSLQLPGIQSRSMAYRFAVERLNDSMLIDLTGTFVSSDKAWRYEIGDVITISHPVGLANKKVRLLSVDPASRGTIAVSFTEYDVNVYSDAIVDEPPPPDYGGATPFQVPPVTGLGLEETFYVSGGGTVKSQLEIKWNPVNYAFLQYFIVEIWELQDQGIMNVSVPVALKNAAGASVQSFDLSLTAAPSDQIVTSIPPGGRLIQTIRTPDTFYNYRDITMGATYFIKVYALSTAFVSGLAAEQSLKAQGYLLPPDFSQGQIVAYEAGDGLEAYVRVGALDIDLWGYEFRYRELSDRNLATKWGPHFVSGDFLSDAPGFDIADGYIQQVPENANTHWIRALDTGIQVGKSYDVFVKLKVFDYPNNSNAGIAIGGAGAAVSGPGTGFIWMPGTTTRPGLYKSQQPWTPTANGYIYLYSYSPNASGRSFVIEYIAFRETAGNADIPSQISSDWDTASFISRAAHTSCRVTNLASGAYIVYCKAIDSVRNAQNPNGQYSVDTKAAYSLVQRDDAAFFRTTYKWDTGSMTNMGMYPMPTLADGFTYAGDDGGPETVGTFCPANSSTWNSRFTTAINNLTTPVYGAFEGSVSLENVVSSVYDLGTKITGNLKFWGDLVSLGSPIQNAVIKLEWADNASFTGGSSANSQVGVFTPFSGRYVRVTFLTTNFKVGMRSNSNVHLEVIATPRAESGTAVTNSPAVNGDPSPLTVFTQNSYTKCLSLRAWSATGEPVNCYCDNITPGNPSSFSIIAVDLNGIPVSTTVNWEWKGV